MKNATAFKHTFRVICMFICWFSQICLSWTCYSYCYRKLFSIQLDFVFEITLLMLYGCILFLFEVLYGSFKIGYYQVRQVVFSQTLSLFISNLILYFIYSITNRNFISIIPCLFLTLTQIAVSSILSILMDRLYKKLYPPHKLLLISGKYASDNIAEKLCTRPDKYCISKIIYEEEGYEKLAEEILQFKAVVLHELNISLREKLLDFCFENNRRVYLTPQVTDIILSGSQLLDLFDSPLMLCRNEPIPIDQQFIKRVLDVVLSGIGLFVSAPVMLFIALLIKLYDHGPVFYRQERLTKDGKIFQICKFRSMRVDAEKDGIARLASEHDTRITSIGRFIRATRLDELPQLINIFKGEMSIVGPRPERPEIAEQYLEDMPEFAYRLKVKAGLTGLAQVVGKYNTTPKDKLMMDLLYVEKSSFLLDLKIMFITLKTILTPDATEGIEVGKTTAVKHQKSHKDFDVYKKALFQYKS